MLNGEFLKNKVKELIAINLTNNHTKCNYLTY